MTDTTSARPSRTASITRSTRESSVEVTLDVDGTGQVEVSTSVPFFDHMLTALGTHARFDLTVRATGDTHIDAHHTVEDTSIVLGQALREALGDKKGIARFGDALVPLDESLAQAVVDLSGESEAQALHLIGGHFTGSLTRHVFESIAHHAAICLHIRLIEGRDPHHIVEAQFKALARALRAACAYDERVLDVPSTKGAL
ncbi:MAG: imidazoleglycerol-phosphate dehydratase HisB [Brachybacterium tyrofermentans]